MTNNDFIILALNNLYQMDMEEFSIKPNGYNQLIIEAQGYKYICTNGLTIESILEAYSTIKGLYAANNWQRKKND